LSTTTFFTSVQEQLHFVEEMIASSWRISILSRSALEHLLPAVVTDPSACSSNMLGVPKS
jgi:hypothetical protein